MSQKNQQIDDQAVAWVVRSDRGTLSPEERAQLEAWLAADPRHLGAYAKAKAVAFRLERMRGISLFRSRPGRPAPKWSRRLVLGGSIAAGVTGLVLISLRKNGRPQTISTAIGQTREVLLNDGSVVTLNTNTELTVNFSPEMRHVQLVRGEALFDVAKDKSRPFVVSANQTQVRAVGTSFTVSVLPSRPVQVVVREGVVEMKRTDQMMSSAVRVSANIKAVAPPDAPITTAGVSDATLERDLAWRSGQIAFDNQALEDAAAEFARYSTTRIIVAPSVAHRTITGLFAANDPIGFARTTAALLDLRLEVKNNQVRLFERPDGPQ